jgi:signal peptidase I
MDMEIKLLIAGVILFFVARLMKKFKESFSAPFAKKLYNEAYEWVETGWSAVILAAFIMFFFLQAFKIPSGSMRMTLLEGDHLFVNKCIYGFKVPFGHGKRIWPMKKVSRGDIVVFRCPPSALTAAEKENGVTKDFIKRCVALAGDTVEIKNKVLYVNGKKQMEPYLNFEDNYSFPNYKMAVSSAQYQQSWETGGFANLSPELIRDNFGPVTVPQGYYFVMGDNRDRSFDARFWGPLSDKYMKGRALFLYWPISRMRLIK